MAYIGNSLQSQVITPAIDTFSGNGVLTTFTLSRQVVSNIAVEAVVNNVPQDPNSAFAINSSNQIVFTGAPSVGVGNIYVRYNAYVGQTIGIGQGTVLPISMSTGGPTWDANGNLTVPGNLLNSIQENVQTASYTFTLADRGAAVAMNNSSAATITVPSDAGAAFPIGSLVYICRIGSGSVTLAAAAGVTLSKTGSFKLFEQITLRKRAANAWIVMDSPTNPAATGGTLTVAAGRNIHTYNGSANFII
jgi:hypothetical protein